MKLTPPNITPGPWQISSGNGIWSVSGNPRVKVADVVTPAPMNGINWQANARAIAALPDVLTALAWLVEAYGCECTSGHVSEGVPCPHCNAKAALIQAGYQITE